MNKHLPVLIALLGFGLVGCGKTEQYLLCKFETKHLSENYFQSIELVPQLYEAWMNGFRFKYTEDKLIEFPPLENPPILEHLLELEDKQGYQYFTSTFNETIKDKSLRTKLSYKFHPAYKDVKLKSEYIDGWSEDLDLEKSFELSGQCREVEGV